MFSDAAIRAGANGLFALDALRWLGGEESFAEEITTSEDVRIEHTKEKDQVWFWATILVAPAIWCWVSGSSSAPADALQAGGAHEVGT